MNIRKIGVIERTYRHAQRYRQILGVLLSYGFGDLIERLKIESYVEVGLNAISVEKPDGFEKHTRPERLRLMLQELGPTFIKLGQILSTQRDVLPPEYVKELEHLQSGVPAFPFKEAKAIVEAELGKPLAESFSHFDEEPIGAASIGQVHRARLATGEEVVVKVQRPGIVRTVEIDVEILMHLATLAERHLDGWDVHRPTEIVERFSRIIQEELDYRREASNMEAFDEQFKTEYGVYIPAVFREATTERLLTMEYIDGCKPSSVEALRQRGFDPAVIADRGFDLLLKQIFVHGLFHADPHPGNHLVVADNVVCYLDFGMVGRLTRSEREDFALIVASVARQDARRAAEAFIRLTDWDREPDQRVLQRELEVFMQDNLNVPLEEMEIGELLYDLLDIVTRHRMRLPHNMLLVIKALATVEGLGRMLDPSFNPVQQSQPFVEEIVAGRASPARMWEEGMWAAQELLRFASDAPGQMRRILQQLRRGEIQIDLQHKNIDPLIHALDRVSNRLSLAVMVGALTIGSSVMVLADTPPRWGELPVLGVLGFLFAGLVAAFLIVDTIREGRG